MNTSAHAKLPRSTDVVIVSAARTPIATAYKGSLAGVDAYDLAQVALGAAVERSGIPVDQFEDIGFGESMQGGGNIGRYVELNFANDAVLTTGDAGTTELDAITGYAGLVAYRHVWSPKARSSLYFAGQNYDNDSSLTGPAALKSPLLSSSVIALPLIVVSPCQSCAAPV